MDCVYRYRIARNTINRSNKKIGIVTTSALIAARAIAEVGIEFAGARLDYDAGGAEVADIDPEAFFFLFPTHGSTSPLASSSARLAMR